LSYAREDREDVTKFAKFLKDNGLTIWFDQRAGIENNDIHGPFAHALRASSFVMLFWSKNAAGSTYVAREVKTAESFGKIIIPLKLDSRGFPIDLKVILQGSKQLDARRGIDAFVAKYDEQLASIIDRIEPRRSTLAPVFAFLNMKGGVGKTTLAANIAGTWNEAHRKAVLMIDLDPQANLSNLLMDSERYSQRIENDQTVISCFEPSLASGAPASPRDVFRSIATSTDAPPY
jgi:hypothetical protein